MKNVSTTLVTALAVVLPSLSAFAAEYDLTTNLPANVQGAVGGVAIFDNFVSQPAGTGVFKPFLTLQNDPIEQGYNTSNKFNNNQPVLDTKRVDNWNHDIKLGDLQIVNGYYVFTLDANEPGANKSLISIDNIRIYTSATDETSSVQNDVSKLDDLGILRWAMNDPLSTGSNPPDLNGYNVENWIKLDSNQSNNDGSNANGGSGQADMIVYIPVADFAGAAATDFVYFYNLNGVHHTADKGLASESGFEEWKAYQGPNPPVSVPDGGSTVMLLGAALASLGGMRSFFKS